MSLKHRLFGLIFNKLNDFKINENLVSFIIDGNNSFSSNYTYIQEELKQKGNFEFFFFNKNKLSIKDMKKLSKSKYIFLNDNFLAMAFMNFHPETIITQLWHAPGAFKKFGASNNNDNDEINLIKKSNEKLTFLINTSKNTSKFYSEAFQIDESKIKPLGLSRMDYYFKKHDNLRSNFDKKYPEACGKKIILYAPTFRENKDNNNVLNFLDIEEFNRQLGKDYILALRIHPKFRNLTPKNSELFLDVSDIENEQELLFISDILISDYSSLAIEFLALNKPVILFTYDLEDYVNNDRGFYFDLNKSSPGVVVRTNEELINTIKNNDFNINQDFIKTQFDNVDGEASKRIIDLVMGNNYD